MNKLTTETFIQKAKDRHGDRYDYSKVEYVNAHTKVCITCMEHGEFWQSPNSHLRGSGCPCCNNNNHKYTMEKFVEKAKQVHGDRYDYSKVEYVNNNTKVCIMCPEHGEFRQTPGNHLFGQGCPTCAKEDKRLKYDTETVVKRFIEVHGDRYDYSKVEYAGITSRVLITCPEHGEFWQTPSLHIKGCGCNKCGNARRNESKMLTTEMFIEKSRHIHGDRYDYSKVRYVNYDTPVTITCPVHGEFEQTPDSHLQGKGCNSCSIRHSGGEEEIAEFIRRNCDCTVDVNNRELIRPYELDIYIPEKNVAIEYNGIRWHTEEFGKGRDYHIDKLDRCNALNVKLIQIFEDEYVKHKDLVLNKLAHMLNIGGNKPRVFGRKCQVKDIKVGEARKFLDKFHIQGFSSSSVYLGCYHDNRLIGVMTFRKVKDEWELTRFAIDYNYVCCGVGGKLFSHFVEKYDPEYVKSFADRRWTTCGDDNLYTRLGFRLESVLKPDYRYVLNNRMERIHKFNLRKTVLNKKYGLDAELTEKDMASRLGYHRIWDCGLFKYVYDRKRLLNR